MSEASPGAGSTRLAIGKTGLQVPRIAFGAAGLGHMPDTYGYDVGEQQACDTIRAIFDSDYGFLDTSRNYGAGRSEARIGTVIRERNGLPPGFVLSTKIDRDMQSLKLDAVRARRSLDESLQALGLDSVPMLHLHDPEHVLDLDDITGTDGALAELFRMKEEGLTAAVGLAAGRIDIMMPLLAEWDFDVLITHNRYTLTNRNAEPMLEQARERGIAVLNAAPYAAGMLAKGSRDATRYVYQEPTDKMLAPVRAIEALCAEHSVPMGAVALQFSMRDPRIASTVCGVSRPERVAQTVAWAQWPIPDALWTSLDEVGYTSDDPEATREYSPD